MNWYTKKGYDEKNIVIGSILWKSNVNVALFPLDNCYLSRKMRQVSTHKTSIASNLVSSSCRCGVELHFLSHEAHSVYPMAIPIRWASDYCSHILTRLLVSMKKKEEEWGLCRMGIVNIREKNHSDSQPNFFNNDNHQCRHHICLYMNSFIDTWHGVYIYSHLLCIHVSLSVCS